MRESERGLSVNRSHGASPVAQVFNVFNLLT